MEKILLFTIVLLIIGCSSEDDNRIQEDHSYYQMLVGDWETKERVVWEIGKITFYEDSTSISTHQDRREHYEILNWRYEKSNKAWVGDGFRVGNGTSLGKIHIGNIELYEDSLHVFGVSVSGKPLFRK